MLKKRHHCSNVATLLEVAMKTTVLTSREFNQHVSEAKHAAALGPVIITDRGRPAHVLLNIDTYRTLSGSHKSLAEALAHPEADEIDFDIPFERETTPPLEFD